MHEILLFGDVHDNLIVPGSSDDIQENFRDFFASANKFYDDLARSSRFKEFQTRVLGMQLFLERPAARMVLGKNLGFYKTEETMVIFEFVAMLLHMLYLQRRSETIDVVLEAPLQPDFGPVQVNNFLDSMRYLFSICPSTTTSTTMSSEESKDTRRRGEEAEQQHPFEAFHQPCRDLFPNVDLHPIDLRFALQEDAIGTFINDEAANISIVLIWCAERMTEQDEPLSLRDFAALLYLKHGVDNAADRELLFLETNKTIAAWRKVSVFWGDKAHPLVAREFVTTLADASKRFWNPADRRSKWFLFRTFLTDIYGLSTLLRPDRQKKAIVYLGDYHARVWAVVLEDFLQYDVPRWQRPGGERWRTIHFGAKTDKPLLADPYGWSTQSLYDSLELKMQYDNYQPSTTWGVEEKRQAIFAFANLMNREAPANFTVMTGRKRLFEHYMVPYFAQAWSRGDPLDLLPNLPDKMQEKDWFKRAQAQTKNILDLRLQLRIMCDSDSDVLFTPFDDMSEKELNSVFLSANNEHDDGKKECFSAVSMHKYWQQLAAEGKVFRNPLTRELVSEHDQEEILKRLHKLYKPVRFQSITSQYVSLQIHHPAIAPPDARALVKYYMFNCLVCVAFLVHENDDMVLRGVLQDVIDHLPHLQFRMDNTTGIEVVVHPVIHFNNFRDVELWRADRRERMAQLLDECRPYSDKEDSFRLLERGELAKSVVVHHRHPIESPPRRKQTEKNAAGNKKKKTGQKNKAAIRRKPKTRSFTVAPRSRSRSRSPII